MKRDYKNEAKEVTDTIAEYALSVLSADSEKPTRRELNLAPGAVQAMLKGAFWASDGSHVYMMADQDLLKFKQPDAKRLMQRHFGEIIDSVNVKKLADAVGQDTAAKKAIAKAVLDFAWQSVLDHLKFYNQRNELEMRVICLLVWPDGNTRRVSAGGVRAQAV